MNLPLPPITTNSLKSNISYGELQAYTFEEVSKWVDLLRTELLNLWNNGQPPYLGLDEKTIIKRFQKLKEYPIDDFSFEDELYPDYKGFIKNFSKMGTVIFVRWGAAHPNVNCVFRTWIIPDSVVKSL